MAGKRKPITFSIETNGCHNCTSHALGTSGYPCVEKDGRNQNLHRVLYEEANEIKLPRTTEVRHTCDNRVCINLAHLILGTNAQNAQDRKERGRGYVPLSEEANGVKLTWKQVSEIRLSKESQRRLAELFGVNQSTISRIKRGLRWPSPKKN